MRKRRRKQDKTRAARAFPGQRGSSSSQTKRGRRTWQANKCSAEAINERPNKNRKVSDEQKAHMMWKVDVAGLPVKEVFHGFAEKLYWKWKKKEHKEVLKTGPPRLLPVETVEEIAGKLKAGAFDSILMAANSYGISRQTLDRELKYRRKERGLKPLSRKKPAKRRTDMNQPRVYDMQMGFIPAYDKIDQQLMSHADEFPVQYGPGEHRKTLYADAGDTPIADAAYRNKNAHVICAISLCPPKILKVSVQEKPFQGDDCYDFYTKNTPSPADCPFLGGPPLVNLLAETSAKFFFHDLLGRGGNSTQPKRGHFHPDIPRAFKAKQILEIKLPPQGHYFNPQEFVNRDLQDLVRKWNTNPGEQASGPQSFRDVELALNAAMEQLRADDGKKEAKSVRNAYHARGSSKDYMKMMETMGANEFKKAYDEVKKKRAEIPRGTSYTVGFNPDGKGTRTVHCMNIAIPDFVEVTPEEAETAARSEPVLNWPGDTPACTYTSRVPRSVVEQALEI